jgi:hypothetical protein
MNGWLWKRAKTKQKRWAVVKLDIHGISNQSRWDAFLIRFRCDFDHLVSNLSPIFPKFDDFC